MTSPMDQNPLLAYLQAWRQLLEASAAIASGWPMPPGAQGTSPMFPGMPQMPPMPAGSSFGAGAMNPPADYAQQLFGLLQSWRQYLEHAVSNATGSIQPLQPINPHQTEHQAPGSNSMGSQSTVAPPSGGQSGGSSGSQSSASESSSSSSSTFPPKTVNQIFLRPGDPLGTITDLKGFGSRGSAFVAKFGSDISPVSAPGEARSLFRSRSADAPAPTVSQAGRDPRRAAPPATSRWWAANEGTRPGFSAAQPEARNLLNLRPTDLGGREQ
jgi:hypothetical protein